MFSSLRRLLVMFRLRFFRFSKRATFISALLVTAFLGYAAISGNRCTKTDSRIRIKRSVYNSESTWSEQSKWSFRGHSLGKAFSTEWEPYLKRLKLDDESIDRIDDVRVLSVQLPAFATAVSDNHFEELMQLIYCVEKYFPGHKLYVYDIGLSVGNNEKLTRCKTVIVKTFDFDNYPDYVRELATVLVDEPAVWWMDSTVKFQHANISEMHRRVGVLTDPGNKYIDYDKVHPVQMMRRTFHGYYSTTDHQILQYFPTDIDITKDLTNFGGSIFLMYGTRWAKRHWLRWIILCALEKDCMAPPGTESGKHAPCYFGTREREEHYREHTYCHRYDQTVMNLVLLHTNHFNVGNYGKDMTSLLTNSPTNIVHNYFCYINSTR